MIAWGRLIVIAGALMSSALIAFLLPSTVKATDIFIQIVPGVCATLAGFLLTAMVLVADKISYSSASWRLIYLVKGENGARLSRYSAVFVLLVVTSFLVTVLSAIDKTNQWFAIIERLAFALTTLSFYAALTLPFILRSIISNAYEIEIKSRSMK